MISNGFIDTFQLCHQIKKCTPKLKDVSFDSVPQGDARVIVLIIKRF